MVLPGRELVKLRENSFGTHTSGTYSTQYPYLPKFILVTGTVTGVGLGKAHAWVKLLCIPRVTFGKQQCQITARQYPCSTNKAVCLLESTCGVKYIVANPLSTTLP
ncbi:unnamed protein product [Aspergillus oryzae]|uniref:Unnamed protein product n=1 Tax=Aspergillus oryzae TaxID=5062 RepID=A0AAN4Z0G2_ASPOZ|nr:unnamed protein product [Aspergillus oryzae]